MGEGAGREGGREGETHLSSSHREATLALLALSDLSVIHPHTVLHH